MLVGEMSQTLCFGFLMMLFSTCDDALTHSPSASLQVYQSLDRELQRHVSLRDALQQCQTWLSNIQEELQPPVQTPCCLEEALLQVTILSFATKPYIAL